MQETPEEENERLLAPYRAARDHAAHECLSAMLDGRHTEAGRLLQEYQLACFALDSAGTITEWFDRASGKEPNGDPADQAPGPGVPDEGERKHHG